jgi:hypothetical protein
MENDIQRKDRLINERSAQLSDLDSIARQPTLGRSVMGYIYSVEFRNVGAQTIKSVTWEYQVSDPSDARNTASRQFQCAEQIKPNKSKEMKAFTPLAPITVIRVSPTGEPQRPLQERVIVNQIEYADGTIKQRAGWKPSKSGAYAADVVLQYRGIKCMGL